MAHHLVLVNGLPGSGKTTLATQLAADLRCALLSKDQIKEALAVLLPGRVPARLGVVAMETMWALARDLDETVIVESFWFKPRDSEFAGDGIAVSQALSSVEIWCDVPVSTARNRYSTRVRSPIHDDSRRLTDDWDRWAQLAAPLSITPVVRVDTTQPTRIADLSGRVRRILDSGAPAGISGLTTSSCRLHADVALRAAAVLPR